MKDTNKFSQMREHGFSTVWVLGFAMLIFLTGAVFFQFGNVLVGHQKLVTAADRASNAGATAIDEEELLKTDGNTIRLNADPKNGDTAVQRCEAVLTNEAGKDRSDVEAPPSSYCTLDGTQKIVTATVKGRVSIGLISGWLGVPEKEFTVVSNARPSCNPTPDDPAGTC